MSQSPRLTIYGVYLWLIATIFFFYVVFQRVFIGTLSDQIIQSFHLTTQGYAYLSSVYFLAFGLSNLLAGILYDRYPTRTVLLLSLGICVLSSIHFNHTQYFIYAYIDRTLIASASGFAFVGVLKVSIEHFPKTWFATSCGLSQLVAMSGAILATGPLVSLTNYSGWHQTLHTINLAGIILLGLSTLCILMKSNHLSPAVTSSNNLLIFKGLIRLLRGRSRLLLFGYTACNYVPIATSCAVWGNMYLESCGLSQQQAANIIAAGWLGYAIMCPLTGMVYQHFRSGKCLMIIFSMAGVISSLTLLMLKGQGVILCTTILFIIGCSASGQTVAYAMIAEKTQQELKATALAINNAGIAILNVIAPLLVSSIVTSVHILSTNITRAAQLGFAMLVIPLMFAISVAFVMMLKKS